MHLVQWVSAKAMLGVYDLYGNVYEWTEDWYQYSLLVTLGCPPSMGNYKVIRGSNACNSLYLRSASRQFAHPDRKAYYIGLRIVRVDNSAQDMFHPDNNCEVGPFCGDGYVNAYEQCDDGNVDSDDGCSATCELEALGLHKVHKVLITSSGSWN